VPPYVDPVDFQSIGFEADQSSRTSVLNPVQVDRLQEVADTLNRFPDLNVLIVGNADKTEGSDAQCQAISEIRALLVYEWLASHGVRSKLNGHKGVGNTHPVDHSDAEEHRRHNRRVDILIQ